MTEKTVFWQFAASEANLRWNPKPRKKFAHPSGKIIWDYLAGPNPLYSFLCCGKYVLTGLSSKGKTNVKKPVKMNEIIAAINETIGKTEQIEHSNLKKERESKWTLVARFATLARCR